MSVLENFKNILRSSYGGRQGSNVIFFSNLQRRPWSKKKGGLSPPVGDRGKPLYIRSNPPLPSSFKPENSTKNPEKKERSEEKESGEALPDSALVIFLPLSAHLAA